MLGYIVVEPNLRVERVPVALLGSEEILWPPDLNQLDSIEKPLQAPGFTNPDDLYYRHPLVGAGIDVYVWSRRDPNALLPSVTESIRARARDDSHLPG